MAKNPANQPSEGDRVKLRGRSAVGLLIRIHPINLWCGVEWDTDYPGPKVVHLNELEKL